MNLREGTTWLHRTQNQFHIKIIESNEHTFIVQLPANNPCSCCVINGMLETIYESIYQTMKIAT